MRLIWLKCTDMKRLEEGVGRREERAASGEREREREREREDDFGSTPDFELVKHEPFGRTRERIYLAFHFVSI